MRSSRSRIWRPISLLYLAYYLGLSLHLSGKMLKARRLEEATE